jgi:hypothetical protein
MRDPALQGFTADAVDAAVGDDLEDSVDRQYWKLREGLSPRVSEIQVRSVVGTHCENVEAVTAASSIGDTDGAPTFGHPGSLPAKRTDSEISR